MQTHEFDPTINTLQSHILAQETVYPDSRETLAWILSALSISAKAIAAQVRRARLVDVLGSAGGSNVQGETPAKARRAGRRDPAAHARSAR